MISSQGESGRIQTDGNLFTAPSRRHNERDSGCYIRHTLRNDYQWRANLECFIDRN